jgi:hypothetical protein
MSEAIPGRYFHVNAIAHREDLSEELENCS